jgi:hypothetical protein
MTLRRKKVKARLSPNPTQEVFNEAILTSSDLRERRLDALPVPAAQRASALAATKLAKNSIGATQIKKNAVVTAKIKNAAVTNSKLADNAVTNSKLAGNAVTSGKIADGQVRAGDLGTILTVQNTVQIGAGAEGTVDVACPAGSIMLSGGGYWTTGSNNLRTTLMQGNGWRVEGKNTLGGSAPLTVQAYCLTG